MLCRCVFQPAFGWLVIYWYILSRYVHVSTCAHLVIYDIDIIYHNFFCDFQNKKRHSNDFKQVFDNGKKNFKGKVLYLEMMNDASSEWSNDRKMNSKGIQKGSIHSGSVVQRGL